MNSDEFQRAFEQISSEALQVASKFLEDPEDARDAVQDAFMKAYEAQGKFRGEARLSTWILKIVINCCLTRKARPDRVREGEVSLETADAEREKAFGESDSLTAAMEMEDFRKLADILPRREAIAFELRYFHDYSYKEISREMNTTLSAVTALISRAHKRMEIRITNERKRETR